MELEQVISELKQLRDELAELKNKFESLLGQVGWFRYNPAPAASNVLNMFKCGICGWFYAPGTFHSCPTNTAQPNFIQPFQTKVESTTPQNPQALPAPYFIKTELELTGVGNL